MKYIISICEFDHLYFVARQSSSNPAVYRHVAQCFSMRDAVIVLAAFQQEG